MSRQYLSAGSIVEEVIKGKSLKAYCASKDNLGKVDYALAMETLKYKDTINKILQSCETSADSLDVREGVLFVMVYEILFGAGKIQGGGSVKRKVMEVSSSLQSALKDLMRDKSHHSELLPQSVLDHAKIGAFIRINTVKTEADEGLEHILTLCPGAKLDTEIPHLVSLPAKATSLGQDEWVKSGKLVIQDKASCFPSQVLYDAWMKLPLIPGTQTRGDFIDACAAPGNKTSHLATLALSTPNQHKSSIKVHAFEKNPRRAKLLRDRMQLMGVDHTVSVNNCDFLGVNVTDPKYSNVTSILLDPSCSGSGVVKSLERVVETVEEETDNDRSDRLELLQSFQIKVILKAMTFPRVQYIVYSTCSIHKEENEMVVAEILKQQGINNTSNGNGSSSNNSNNNINDTGKPSKKGKTSSVSTAAASTTESTEASGWRLVPPQRLQHWPRRGEPLTPTENTNNNNSSTVTTQQQLQLSVEDSAALVRCAPEDGTNGFFVSLFERVGPLPSLPTYIPTTTQDTTVPTGSDSVTWGKKRGKGKTSIVEEAEYTQKRSKTSKHQSTAAVIAVHSSKDSTGTTNRKEKVTAAEKPAKGSLFLNRFKVQKRKHK